nr:competence protein ComK [Listeria grayi]
MNKMNNESKARRIYEINPYTMVILPKRSGEEIFSEIYEIGSSFISKFTPFEIIKTSCKFFGSNFEGRKDGTKHLIGITHKPPIIIDAMNLIYAFPTTSPSKNDCAWIFPQHIQEYGANELNQTVIQFTNHRSIEIDISTASFNNQMARTSMLHMKISQKMRKMEKEFPLGNMYFPPATIAAESRAPYSVPKPENGSGDTPFFQ